MIELIFLLVLFIIVFIIPLLFVSLCAYAIYISLKKKNNANEQYGKLYKVLLISIICIFITYVIGFVIFNNSLCTNSAFPKVISTEGTYDAQLLAQNCGTTTSFQTKLELGKVNGTKVTILSTIDSPNDINLNWLSDDTLQVSYIGTDCSSPYSKKRFGSGSTSWNDISIKYINNCDL